MNGSALSSSDTEGIHQRPQSVPSDNSCLLIVHQTADEPRPSLRTMGTSAGAVPHGVSCTSWIVPFLSLAVQRLPVGESTMRKP